MAFAPSFPQPPARLRLSSPGQVLAAVPYLLGFAPSQSVVVLSLRGKQIGLTMRLDLDTPPAKLRETVVNRLRSDGATTAVIMLFDPDDLGGPGARPGARIARPLIRAVRRAGLEVRDALVVADGRFWSYLCDEPACCPPEGRLLPAAGDGDTSLVASTFVAMGSAPLASRDELSASVGPASPERRAGIVPAFERALAAPAPDPLGRWWGVVRRYADGPPRSGRALPDSEVAQLVVSLRDVAVRDEILGWTAGAEITGVLAVLRELAPLALEPFDAQVLASLAWTAYSLGDGALAAVALARARDADPGHTLARLLELALESGVKPEHLQSISSQLLADLRQLEYPDSSRSRDAR